MIQNAVISEYHGEKKLAFDFEGHAAFVAIPHSAADGNPWLWRAEFFGAFDNVDAALLKNGWHIAHVKLSDMFGHPDAIKSMKHFRDYIVMELSLSKKAVLAGISRGGLYSVNYAVTYPDDISGLYLDAPVLNLLSWPLGLGDGVGSERDSKLCLDLYGLDKGSILNFRENPIDKCGTLLENKMPICFICGGADDIVPYHENSERMIEIYKAHGGKYKLFYKPDCGHHPHSLDDPTDAVDYIEKHMYK